MKPSKKVGWAYPCRGDEYYWTRTSLTLFDLALTIKSLLIRCTCDKSCKPIKVEVIVRAVS